MNDILVIAAIATAILILWTVVHAVRDTVRDAWTARYELKQITRWLNRQHNKDNHIRK